LKYLASVLFALTSCCARRLREVTARHHNVGARQALWLRFERKFAPASHFIFPHLASDFLASSICWKAVISNQWCNMLVVLFD
jgi:hypothetical protein